MDSSMLQPSHTYGHECSCRHKQVLGMLGSVAGKRLVELGAGIGRFTGELARSATHVLAVDFMDNLIQQNRDSNTHCTNVEW